MLAESRRQRILELVEQRGMVKATELGNLFDVALPTIRRDLEALEEKGLIHRVHGGAVSVRGRSYEAPFPQRSTTNQEAKRRIAQAAAQLVADGDSVALDVGTTVLEMAQFLAERRNLTVITHNLRAAFELATHGHHRVLVTGGLLRPDELSLVGHLAEQTHAQFFVDKLFLGAAGVSPRGGLTDYNIEQVLVKKAMLAQAKERILLVDHSKFGYVAFAHVCALSDINCIVTDVAPSAEMTRALDDAGVDLILASGDQGTLLPLARPPA